VERYPEVLILVDKEHRESGTNATSNRLAFPYGLCRQENDVVEVDEAVLTQQPLVLDRQVGQTAVTDLPAVDPIITVNRGSPEAIYIGTKALGGDPHVLHRLVEELPLNAVGCDPYGLGDVELRDTREGADDVSEAELVERPDERISEANDTERFEPTFKFAGALVVVRDAGNAARGPHVLSKESRHLCRQQLRLAASWTGQRHAVAFRFEGLPLFVVAAQLLYHPLV